MYWNDSKSYNYCKEYIFEIITRIYTNSLIIYYNIIFVVSLSNDMIIKKTLPIQQIDFYTFVTTWPFAGRNNGLISQAILIT